MAALATLCAAAAPDRREVIAFAVIALAMAHLSLDEFTMRAWS